MPRQDVNEIDKEKSRKELHKNVKYCSEQILEATTIRPLSHKPYKQEMPDTSRGERKKSEVMFSHVFRQMNAPVLTDKLSLTYYIS